MGLFSRAGKGASSGYGAANQAAHNFGNATVEAVGNAAGKVKAGPIGRAAGATVEFGGKVVGGAAGLGTAILSPLKKPAIIAGVLAGAAIITGGLAYMTRKGRKEDRVQPEALQDLPPVMPTMDMMPQNTMMGMQPAPGMHAQRIVDGRTNQVGGPGGLGAA